jgi:hypothetical protein
MRVFSINGAFKCIGPDFVRDCRGNQLEGAPHPAGVADVQQDAPTLVLCLIAAECTLTATVDHVSECEEKYAKGELVGRHIPFVFNISQVDGLPARLPVAPGPEVERLASVDAYLVPVGATVRLGGDRALTHPRPIR